MLHLIPWVIGIYIASAFGSWSLRRRHGVAAFVGALGAAAASALGLYAAVLSLAGHQLETRRLAWNVPYTSFTIGLDQTSTLFLLPAFAVGMLIALSTLRRTPGDYATNHPQEYYPAFNACLAGVTLILTARNATLFLFAWEIMTLASFLLVENTQRQPQDGGWMYLTAGHLGCACLFAMFGLMAMDSGSLEFAALRARPEHLSIVFVLACAGFGAKFGLFPMHAYYPESYSRSPFHVGAILSGIVGNMGLYGLMRLLLLMGGKGMATPPMWWGYTLLAAGLASGVIGAARSLAAQDLYRLLAWSSVENYGLMAAGLGIGLIGAATGDSLVAGLGFGATGIHMLNHSLSKSLLFLCAGKIVARAGTRRLDAMAGLGKCLPLTAALFLIGALGAAAVPPLNGFAGEFLLLLAAFGGAAHSYATASYPAAAMIITIILVAVIGGLAVAAYVRAFGCIFLGSPRGAAAGQTVRERAATMLPQTVLALLAVSSAALTPWVVSLTSPGTTALARRWLPPGSAEEAMRNMLETIDAYQSVFTGFWLLAGCIAAVGLVRYILFAGKTMTHGPTWDCGYSAPDARMQYTAGSFARPLAETYQPLVGLRDRECPPEDLFPAASSFESNLPDATGAWGFSHAFRLISRLAARVRVVQGGLVQAYVLYMAVALVALLLWKLWNI